MPLHVDVPSGPVHGLIRGTTMFADHCENDHAQSSPERDRVLSLPRTRVLLADDNAVIIDTVRHLLEPTFSVVGAVTDGALVGREAAALNPDVVILDISMGEHDGITVARELQEVAGHLKLVFLTVHELSEFIRTALSAGGAAYVFKSRLRTDLIPAIHAACSGKVFVSCRGTNNPR